MPCWLRTLGEQGHGYVFCDYTDATWGNQLRFHWRLYKRYRLSGNRIMPGTYRLRRLLEKERMSCWLWTLGEQAVTDTYYVTTPMQHGGKQCDFADGYIKDIDCPETESCPDTEYDPTITYPGTSPDNYKKYCDEILAKGYCKYTTTCGDECNPR
jgi:hypothetical protein